MAVVPPRFPPPPPSVQRALARSIVQELTGTAVSCPSCFARYLFEADDPPNLLCPSCRPRGGLGACTRPAGEPSPFELAGVEPEHVQEATGRPPPTPIPSGGRKYSA